jgi:DNA-binding NarL/FixJ family response regulator
MTTDKIKLIIVDDHPMVVEGIRITLMDVEQIEITETAGDAEELFEILKRDHLPDIILLDITLPTLSGIEITEILSEKYPSIKVIILSANLDEESIRGAIRAGAKGYLPKNSRRSELIEAINEVYHGEDFLGERISSNIIKHYLKQAKSGESFFSKPKDDLSEREIEIVRLLSSGLSYKEIADKLFISSRTVESHKNNIMTKLDLHTLPDLIKYAIRNKIISL